MYAEHTVSLRGVGDSKTQKPRAGHARGFCYAPSKRSILFVN